MLTAAVIKLMTDVVLTAALIKLLSNVEFKFSFTFQTCRVASL